MNNKEKEQLLRKLGEKLKASLFSEEVEVTLQDGSKLIISGDLAIGVSVTNSDGSPVTNGEYILEDGRTMSVTDGVVAEIKEAEASKEEEVTEVEQASEGEAPADTPVEENTEEKSVEDRLTALESVVNQIIANLETQSQVNEAQMEKQNTLEEKVNEFAKQPADTPISQRREAVPMTDEEIRIAKLRKIAQMRA